jgi:K+-transporting ATPase ATPase B chain
MAAQSRSLFDPAILGPAVGDAFKKLNPRTLARNPVMFAVEVVSAATTILFVRDLFAGTGASFSGQISLWLWFRTEPNGLKSRPLSCGSATSCSSRPAT